jgi:hypothetical protein
MPMAKIGHFIIIFKEKYLFYKKIRH